MTGFYGSTHAHMADKVRELLASNGYIERKDITINSSVIFVKKDSVFATTA